MEKIESAIVPGTLTLVAEAPQTFLVVRDRFRQEVKAGLDVVSFTGSPGVYSVEVRVPGRQSEELFVVERAVKRTESIPALMREPVVPIPGHMNRGEGQNLFDGYATMREAVESENEQTLRGKLSSHGFLVLTIWLTQDDELLADAISTIQIRARDGDDAFNPRIAQGIGFQILSFFAPAGTCQIEYSAPNGERRAQALPVDAGWTTDVYLRVTRRGGLHAATAVMAMFRNGQRSLGATERTEAAARTEIALDALSIGHMGIHYSEWSYLAKGDIGEPIRAMAAGYARLTRCSQDTNSFLFPRRERGQALGAAGKPQVEEVLTKWFDGLEEVSRLGAYLSTLLPHSVDARLITVAAIWERAALERLARGESTSTLVSTLRELLLLKWLRSYRIRMFFRRAEVTVYWILAAGAALGSWGLIVYLISLTRSSWNLTGSPVTWVLLGLPLPFVIAAWIRSLVNLNRNQLLLYRSHFLFSDPPVFSAGMTLLLRLAALHQEICATDSRIADVALRLTTDSIWTRWDSDTTPHEARRRFAEAMADLERLLLPETERVLEPGKRTPSSDSPAFTGEAARGEAARHLAVSLQLPLSLLVERLRNASGVFLERIRETSTEVLWSFFLERSFWASQSSKAVEIGKAEEPIKAEEEPIKAEEEPIKAEEEPIKAEEEPIKAEEEPIKAEGKGGPTIIEILVVISIIGIISAILFPIFAPAGGPSRQTTCSSHLKRIALSVLQYSQDHDGVFPPSIGSGTTVGWADAIQPYLNDIQVYQCPSDNSRPASSPTAVGYIDYFYNSNLSQRSEAALLNRSRLIISGDGDTGSASYARSSWPSKIAMTRHSGGANYAFVDAHTKWLLPQAARQGYLFKVK